MKEQLQAFITHYVEQAVSNEPSERYGLYHLETLERKKWSLQERNAEIVKARAKGAIDRVDEQDDVQEVYYWLHHHWLIRQKDHFYVEEALEKRKAEFYREQLMDDAILPLDESAPEDPASTTLDELDVNDPVIRAPFTYDRRKAVQYAERWWNSYNPKYEQFENDCTNFISQCLHEGGAPMRGYPNRGSGWWMQNNNWSYSWSVAHSLKNYLANSTTGLRAKEVSSARELKLGDVICYDFEGDGRYNHNTIVTAKDANGEPLVNAHTYNSRNRYWAYEDSTAYTPNIRYTFFTIVDD